jgi:hypothetical protein
MPSSPRGVALVGPRSGDRVREAEAGGGDGVAGIARLGGGEAVGGDLGVGEDDAGDGAVVGAWLVAGDVGAGDPRLVFGDVGKGHHAGEVADRPDAVGGAAALVDLDATSGGVQADRFEPQPVQAGRASHGDEQLLAADLLAAGEANDLAPVGGRVGRCTALVARGYQRTRSTIDWSLAPWMVQMIR